MTQRLLVYQSLWAMEQRRPDGFEWSLEQKPQMIRDAGFDGAGVRFFDRDYARQVTGRLREWGLSGQAPCYPQRVEGLVPVLENVAEFGADHLRRFAPFYLFRSAMLQRRCGAIAVRHDEDRAPRRWRLQPVGSGESGKSLLPAHVDRPSSAQARHLAARAPGPQALGGAGRVVS